VDDFGPGVALLLMAVVLAVLVGVGAAVAWAIITGWRGRRR
jgi:hypothetical protein